jgi:hypothetical protein
MRVTCSHFHDSAEPDAKGRVAWVYDGDDILMEASDQRLTFRRYTDEPARAYILASWAALMQLPRPFLAFAFRHMRSTYAVVELCAQHPGRGYAPLDAASASAVATGTVSSEQARELLAVWDGSDSDASV